MKNLKSIKISSLLICLFSFFSNIISASNKISSYKTIHINTISASGLTASFVAKFSLFIAILLITTILVGKILKITLNIPMGVGQIIGGVILGPSFFKLKKLPFFSEPLQIIDITKNHIFSIASSDLFFFFVLLLSSAITVSYLLWLAGHETDIQDMARVGFESTVAGFLGAIIPIIMIASTIYYFIGSDFTAASSLGIGLIFSATSVSIPIAMLMKENKMHLRSSKATMGAAIVDDIFSVILFSFFVALLHGGIFGKPTHLIGIHEPTGITSSLIHIISVFIIMFVVGKFLIGPTIKKLKTLGLHHIIPTFATLMMLFYFSLSELIGGLAGITGAYFAGVFHRIEDKKHRAVRAISPFVNTILLPIFLGSIGMQVNINILKPSDWFIILAILFVAIFSKFLGCLMTTSTANFFIKNKCLKWTFLETYIFGASMATRGEVALVLSTILKSANIINTSQYVICVTVIVLTAIFSPILLSIGFKKLDKLKKEEEKEFSITIGPFKYISSRYLFDMLSSNLEKTHKINPIITLAEGKKILTAGKYIKIILDPQTGITFKGKESSIKIILENLKISLNIEIEKIPDKILEN
ncbi:cation:proton antiporter [Candidatus Babeliales bacterium]|nr:cation:proton antiporter [Candidatus Babeliales bacterium]